MEQDAIMDDPRGYEYYMRTDPGMREWRGDIEVVDDELTGRSMRRRLAGIATMRGGKLREHQVYLDPIPHIRGIDPKNLQGWYANKHEESPHSRVRPCMTDAILTQPYGGYCTVGCTFCYINSGMKGYHGSGVITVPVNYGVHVARQLGMMNVSAAGYFSSFTDPFQSLEDYYHNTQQGAKAFVDVGLPIFFLSRLKYPWWAQQMLTLNPYSYMQKSINTPSEEDWRQLSPGAATLAEHMEDIRQAKANGVYVSIQVNPIVPGIVTHDDIEELFGMLAEAGADHVIVKFVEAGHPWAPAMVEKVTKRFGANRAAAFRDLFTENCCGGQKTITEEYRREGHTRYQRRATELGMTYSLCYEYTRRDGEWKSMGPEFLTADQCHGHRVPMHRRVLNSFTPLEVCPPSGCLSCADVSGTVPCGSALLAEAKALTLSDLRKPL